MLVRVDMSGQSHSSMTRFRAPEQMCCGEVGAVGWSSSGEEMVPDLWTRPPWTAGAWSGPSTEGAVAAAPRRLAGARHEGLHMLGEELGMEPEREGSGAG